MRLGERRQVTGITMRVGGVTEIISVTSRPDIAPLDSGEKSARLTSEQIQNVPMVGRSTAELLKLLPGMTPISGSTNNSPGFNGEIIGINGNGDGGKQSAIGNFSGNGTRADALDIVIDGAHASDPGCNCATSVNPNPDMVGEFKVLQSNYGAEHAKGPITIDVISKAGGRDFHGMGYLYLRDYRMNSNEWRLNKFSTEPGAENKPKNQFAYPGFNLGGPLIIPGTGFNSDRNRVFFFTGYEYYKQRLDTGILQSWVPTEAMINGDFSNTGSFSSLEQLVREHDAHQPGERARPGEPDRSQRAGDAADAAAAERGPGAHEWLQLHRERRDGSEHAPVADASRRQRQRQHQDLRALQPAVGDAELPGRPVVAQRRTRCRTRPSSPRPTSRTRRPPA